MFFQAKALKKAGYDVSFAFAYVDEKLKRERLKGFKVIEKFVRSNYLKFTILQMTKMLGVTPGVIQDILTDTQLARMY